jgi:membrane-associated phospholipid phosphatase
MYVGNFQIDFSSFYTNPVLVSITFMGDAWFALGVVFILAFLFRRKRLAQKLSIGILITLLISQALKNILNGAGTQLFFEESILSSTSVFSRNFISSHTASIFTLTGFFFIYSKNMLAKTVVLFIAITVAYTRIELVDESIIALTLGLIPAAAATFFMHKTKQLKGYSNRVYYFKETKKERVAPQFSPA